jgi:uncharacterized protein (DUF305 family)
MSMRSAALRPLLLLGTAAAVAAAAAGPEDDFLAASGVAMQTMMAGMNRAPTGDVDADFAALMIPHHQGAIDMARSELRYGHNEALRRMAQEIIVEQQQEIAAMRLAVAGPGAGAAGARPALPESPP